MGHFTCLQHTTSTATACCSTPMMLFHMLGSEVFAHRRGLKGIFAVATFCCGVWSKAVYS